MELADPLFRGVEPAVLILGKPSDSGDSPSTTTTTGGGVHLRQRCGVIAAAQPGVRPPKNHQTTAVTTTTQAEDKDKDILSLDQTIRKSTTSPANSYSLQHPTKSHPYFHASIPSFLRTLLLLVPASHRIHPADGPPTFPPTHQTSYSQWLKTLEHCCKKYADRYGQHLYFLVSTLI